MVLPNLFIGDGTLCFFKRQFLYMVQYSQEFIKYLWQQFVDSKATGEELNFLLKHISDNRDEEYDVNVLEAYLSKKQHDDTGDEALFAENLKKIFQSQTEDFFTEGFHPELGRRVRKIPLFKKAWLRYAAALILMFGIGIYFYQGSTLKKQKPAVAIVHPKERDILPGSDKAILTLSSGKKVNLNADEKATIVDGKLAISNEKGELKYEESNVVVYNTMSTPKGGQYRLTLPDDTKVWLNAASSITFPTSFPGKVRSVSITGEAYFEVTHNALKPFRVTVNGKEEIEVLGTHFNVHAYTDEDNFKTSLLEGAIRIGHDVLIPGQAYLNGKIVNTDLEQDIAWKDGVFNLNKMELKEIMLQFSRWYDIEVIYKGAVPKTLFYGEIGRDLSLSEALKGLEDSKIKFRIDQERKIIVNP